MSLSGYLPQINLDVQEEYFSGSENVQEFLEGIVNQIRLLEIPNDLSCAYLKGPLLGRAPDWYQIFGSASVQNTATDLAQLKAAFSKAFPAIRNKKDLEIKFYASQQRRDWEPKDFVYDLLKLNKRLKLGMSEKALVDPISLDLNHKCKIMWRFEIHKTRSNCWRPCLSFRKDIHAKQCGVRGIVIMWKDEVGMSVGCLMLIVEEIREIRKMGVDRVMAEMIIGVTTRMAVKEISGSTAGIDFRRMIEDLTIGDTNLEMEVKKSILVEGTAEIEVRVRILVEAIGGKGDD
ncbi:uncharacterized protein TNCV_4230291 [Trichonephila clavipes]|uniref:Retrotransposon gag domain-containing protein n=1 Tax=Trichonephila clavipes TaxID=2585209 RepID=A0A8X6SHK2_TRICX|nr:uncharacterized protein TNCV_4230291 [Trichonephila clavipes]